MMSSFVKLHEVVQASGDAALDQSTKDLIDSMQSMREAMIAYRWPCEVSKNIRLILIYAKAAFNTILYARVCRSTLAYLPVSLSQDLL